MWRFLIGASYPKDRQLVLCRHPKVLANSGEWDCLYKETNVVLDEVKRLYQKV